MFDAWSRTCVLLGALALLVSPAWCQRRPTPTPTPIPGSVVQQVERANDEFRQGRREEAISLYRVALEQAPTYVEGHYRLGVALAEGGRFLEAEKAFKQALELDPNFTAAQNMLTKYQAEIDAARNPTPTPTPRPAPIPGTATGMISPATGPKFTADEQALIDQLRAMPPDSQVLLLLFVRLVRVGFGVAVGFGLMAAFFIGAIIGVPFWLLGKTRGHSYPACWMYGTSSSLLVIMLLGVFGVVVALSLPWLPAMAGFLLGIILVFLPAKISRIVVLVVFLGVAVGIIMGWSQLSAVDLDVVRHALEDAASRPAP